MKKSLAHKVGREAFSKGFDLAYSRIQKDRKKAVLDLINLSEKYMSRTNFNIDYDKLRLRFTEENSPFFDFFNRMVDELDKNVFKTAALNMAYETMFSGAKQLKESREKLQCNVPWFILMDPTSACNLKCTGCWSAEYGRKLNLSLEELDGVINQAEELGVHMFMYTGGEPLVRKDDLIKLCDMHRDCTFLAFTNGTLVDEDFCKELVRVGNLYLAISLEGFEDTNDGRRGDGVFNKVMHSMDLLKQYGCLFGTSICYTSKNVETITSKEFIEMQVSKGVKFSMYFHYMPVGNGASPELIPTLEQRKYMIKRVEAIRKMWLGTGFPCLDFQNDGVIVDGCIAGGRNYFHINSNGDAEPCVFIHYSNTNIRTHTLVEILQSPLFMAYYRNQPFNHNHLRPCPMLENPEILPRLVKESGAHSTDLQSPESAEHLCSKCKDYSKQWKPEAEVLYPIDLNKKEKACG